MSENARVQVAEAIANELPTRCYMDTTDCLRVADVAIAAHLESLHPVIETVEQLDALPVGAVVLDDMSDVLQRFNAAGGWILLGYDGLHLPVLPAVVLHVPESTDG